MELSVWPNLQQPWESTLALAREASETGWSGLWYADHFIPSPTYPAVLEGLDASRDAPTNESWTTLAALAAAVPKIRLGTLVTGNTYRHPAVLAKMAANVDIISGGRLVLGIGAGWDENEHRAYGIPFPPLTERLSRLEEACEVLTLLFAGGRATFVGRFYELDDAPLQPGPVQRPVPLLVGGEGEQRTMRIAAKYASAWNMWGSPDKMRAKLAVLDRRCEELGRDPTTLKRTVVTLIAPRDDESHVRWVREGGRPMVGCSASEIRDTVAEYAEIGIQELIIPDFGLGRGQERAEHYARFRALTLEALPQAGVVTAS